MLMAGFGGVVIAMLVGGQTQRSAYYVPIGFLVLAGIGSLLRGDYRKNAVLLLAVLAPMPWIADAALGSFQAPSIGRANSSA